MWIPFLSISTFLTLVPAKKGEMREPGVFLGQGDNPKVANPNDGGRGKGRQKRGSIQQKKKIFLILSFDIIETRLINMCVCSLMHTHLFNIYCVPRIVLDISVHKHFLNK